MWYWKFSKPFFFKLKMLFSTSFFRAFGSNNFSGSLPPELGNLVRLEQIYIDSFGVSGDIPSTFAKLQNMQILWASDNLFTGKIPDFISNWTKLTTL
ncbi:hypothetical protein HHK36_004751 [Tetracentron sinense]|uniref:Non-specific serine/threonine protein kinase n=1 Tax=Tetracentron sinense TaxID=13715 RepID=A0A835DLU3_TETSI|nr:hypothetical protein HHK36_004751 [Tetracentron sinense]